MCFTTKLAQRLRKTCFRNVSEKAFQASFPEIQIPAVLQGISFRGCESLVFVTYLNLSVRALYSTLVNPAPRLELQVGWAHIADDLNLEASRTLYSQCGRDVTKRKRDTRVMGVAT